MTKSHQDDILIAPVGNRMFDKPGKITPLYLVSIEDGKNKTQKSLFFATKLDESSHSVKLVGFDLQEDEKKVCENYADILQSTDKSLYKEITVPWTRICRIQNLIFKAK